MTLAMQRAAAELSAMDVPLSESGEKAKPPEAPLQTPKGD